jgi:hypothetical protein
MKSEKAKSEAISDEFTRILGVRDSDSATSVVKSMLEAEIACLEREEDTDGIEMEMAMEKEIREGLRGELELVERSLDEFNKHRETAVNALNKDLKESQEYGYLRLLTEETNELQRRITSKI